MDLVAKAPPDGYTLALGSFGPMVVSPYVYSKLPFDPVKDFEPITLAATSWFFLVVNPSVPARNVKELIALSKTDSHFKRHSSPIGTLSLAGRSVNLVKIRSSLAVFPGICASQRPIFPTPRA